MLDTGLPSYLKELELDDVTKSLMGGGGGGMKRISIKGGVWRMMGNGKEIAKNEDRSMNVVIVNAAPKVSRTFYMGTYKEGEVSSPDCWSADGDLPDAKAQNPQAKRCVDCPQNVKGSGQGDSRACRFSQRLAVVLANDIKGDVFQLTLPGQSIFGEGAGRHDVAIADCFAGAHRMANTVNPAELLAPATITVKHFLALELEQLERLRRSIQSNALAQGDVVLDLFIAAQTGHIAGERKLLDCFVR